MAGLDLGWFSFFLSPGHSHEGAAVHAPHQARPRAQLLRLLLRDPQLAGPRVLARQAGEPMLLARNLRDCCV